MSPTWQQVRQILALVVGISFVLPLAQCPRVERTRLVAATAGQTATSSAPDVSDAAQNSTTASTSVAASASRTPIQYFDISAYSFYRWPSVGAFALLALFFWPLSAELSGVFRRKLSRLAMGVAFLLSVLSALSVTWLVWWGRSVRYGAFIAYGAIVGYAVALLLANRTAPQAPRPEKP